MCSERGPHNTDQDLAQPVREMEQDRMDSIPDSYPELLEDIKRRIAESRVRTARVKANLSVNRELV